MKKNNINKNHNNDKNNIKKDNKIVKEDTITNFSIISEKEKEEALKKQGESFKFLYW